MSNAEAQVKKEEKANVKRREIHKGRIFTVVQDEIVYDSQQKKTFDLVLHPGAVAIVPINSHGELLLVKQWRRAAQRILLELPAGTLEAGENPIDCAARELREETGYRAAKITPLLEFYSAPGILSEYLYLYIATELSHDPLIGEDTEEIDLVTLSFAKALEMIARGEIIDAKTIAGILAYKELK